MPRRSLPQKRGIPNVKKVLAVASGKGGVGKSTVAVNLAFSLAKLRLRVGILDLDIFGPSVPTLMGLADSSEPRLTPNGALIPLTNHGLPTMSMGYLAVQQLLFDVDWGALDVLVLDMPPGTGDVPLTLGQLVNVDGSVIVSTPQDVALKDVNKGVAMFRKVDVPITGIVLNQSHFICGNCDAAHYLFGSPEGFRSAAERLGVDVLAELPLVPGVSVGGDCGIPYALKADEDRQGKVWNEAMMGVATKVQHSLGFV
ncbi:P-loop containing nucleoside triphosphate hydrolase protein [Hymenopellis radicata]|nr:P-loop containing nucleoside triphosphate hydrolase protein [Hymenopellis radicata]